jgi:hypothetical protein
VEIRLRFRLVAHPHARGRKGSHVAPYLDGIAGDHAAIVPFLADLGRGGIVEGRMDDGEDERPARRDQLCQGAEERLDRGHVEEGHVAESGVEGRGRGKGFDERRFVGGIQNVVRDSRFGVRLASGCLDHPGRKVKGVDPGPKPGQAAGGETVAAGGVQDALAGLRVQQTQDGRPLQDVGEIVAFAHALVPESGVGIPGLAAGFVVSIDIIGLHWVRSSNRSSPRATSLAGGPVHWGGILPSQV